MIIRVLVLCAYFGALLCRSEAKAQEALTNSSIIDLVREQFNEALDRRQTMEPTRTRSKWA